MKFVLFRKYPKPTYTIGDISRGGKFMCDSLEDPVRELVDMNNDNDFDDPGEGKIYGDTAIPCGTYEIVIKDSPHFKREMMYLEDVSGFKFIMIHALIDQTQTLGCIGPGENRVKGKLVNSKYWEAVIKNFVREDEENGIKSYITIKQ